MNESMPPTSDIGRIFLEKIQEKMKNGTEEEKEYWHDVLYEGKSFFIGDREYTLKQL